MRKLMQMIAVAGGLIALISPPAIAGSLTKKTETITLDFETLGAYPYIFSASDQYYQNHPLAEAGVKLRTSSTAQNPTGRVDPNLPLPSGQGSHDLEFDTDVIFDGYSIYPSSITKIVAFNFKFKSGIEVIAPGIDKTFSCASLGCWDATGLFNLGTFDNQTNEYAGVDSIRLTRGSGSLGVIDSVALTLRYDSSVNEAPEPASLGLAFAALFGAGLFGRRRERLSRSA